MRLLNIYFFYIYLFKCAIKLIFFLKKREKSNKKVKHDFFYEEQKDKEKTRKRSH